MSDFEEQPYPGFDAAEAEEWDEVEINELWPKKGQRRFWRGPEDDNARLDREQSTEAGTQQEVPGSFDLEVSDLPPTTQGHHLLISLGELTRRLLARLENGQRSAQLQPVSPSLSRRQRRLRVGQMLTVFGLCAALLLLLAGSTPTFRNYLVQFFQPALATPTSNVLLTQAGQSKVVVHGRSEHLPVVADSMLGPVPNTCPKDDVLQDSPQAFGVPVLGVGPLWAMGFAGPSAALIQLSPYFTSMSQPPGAVWGWYASVTFFIPKGYTGNILLQGASQTDDIPLTFSNADMLQMGSLVTFNPLNPEKGTSFTDYGQWKGVPLNIVVTEAGCYYLQISWNGQKWTTYFAAGLRI